MRIAPPWAGRGHSLSEDVRDYIDVPALRVGFDPTSIPGCKMFLDARTLGLSNDDPVSEWRVGAGTGYVLTQSTGAKQPTYKSSEINSLPAVQFDGTDDILEFTNADFGDAFSGHMEGWSFVAVIQLPSTGQNTWWWEINSSSDNDPYFGFYENSSRWTYQSNDDQGGTSTSIAAQDTDTNPNVVAHMTGGMDMVFRVNGSPGDDIGGGSGSATGARTLDRFSLGALHLGTNSQSDFSNFSLAMLAMWNRRLTLGEIGRVEEYMGDAYSITIS